MTDLSLPRTDHATWEETFFRAAYVFADRSKDPSTQVGAVIATAPDAAVNGRPVGNRLLSQGYNGAPNGWEDHEFPWAREGESAETKYPYVIHAEKNAMLNFFGDTSNLRGAVVYVTHFPCFNCVKDLAQVGIAKIVYDRSHAMPDDSATEIAVRLAEKCGVELVQSEQPEHVRGILSR